MAEKPSLFSSTLTILAVWSVAWFTFAATYVGIRLAHGMEEKLATVILAPFASLLTGFGMSYLTARKLNGEGKPNGVADPVQK